MVTTSEDQTEVDDDLADVELELTHSTREVTLGLLPSTNLDAVRSMLSGRPWTWRPPAR